ncbi:C40 family peptidase [Terrabacter sp. NPDC080008]|uniref:C40 family peptidase n=1 Tax=Terrabacter sp. NPDC080008 TaxID=3155176 RepID=UPI00344BBA9C
MSAVTVHATPAYAVPLRTQGLRLTAAQVGKWYRWGGAGPTYFDCSGLVYYVFHTRLHQYLPRTANAQRLATIRIAKANILPGDLIFFMSGGRAYHVGVYAGSGKVWHAPRPGQRVQLSRLWTTAWVAGRVR